MFTTFLLLLAMTLLFVGVGRILAGKRGMIFALGLAIVMNFVSYYYSDTIALNAYQAKPAPAGHRLIRITQDLATEAGVPMPTVYIIPSNTPNAFATGRSPEKAAVAATEGIMKLLTDDELKGVMAHELGHVQNRDTLISTVAASLAGGIMILSRVALFLGGRERSSWAKTLAVSILAPLAASVVTFAISRTREYEADEYGGRLTRRPLDLASALLKLEAGVKQKPMPDHSPETAHMFIINPFGAMDLGSIFSSHPKTHKRVARLKKLKQEL